jgi:hypothetical protein
VASGTTPLTFAVPAGAQVTASASGAAWPFAGWSVDGVDQGLGNPVQLQISADTRAVARYQAAPSDGKRGGVSCATCHSAGLGMWPAAGVLLALRRKRRRRASIKAPGCST